MTAVEALMRFRNNTIEVRDGYATAANGVRLYATEIRVLDAQIKDLDQSIRRAQEDEMKTEKTEVPPRDYFAARAPVTLNDALNLTGMSITDLRDKVAGPIVMTNLAGLRYAYADAMLEARK